MQNRLRTGSAGVTAIGFGIGIAIMRCAAAEPLDIAAGARNLSPVAALFALEPPVARRDPGMTVEWTTASHALGESEGDNVVLFDGETSVLTFSATQRFGDDWRVTLSLPYVWHSAGVLDPLIDRWHDLFGLPDGIRDDVPRDQLVFEYSRDGEPAVLLTRNRHGVGDVRVAASWSPAALSRRGLSIGLGAKLPTGDADRLTGSGAADVSAVVHWRREAAGTPWSLDASIGLAALGEAELELGDQRRRAIIGHAGASYRFSDAFALGGRLQIHEGPVADAPDPLSEPAVMLVVGGSVALSRRWRLAITVDEDLNVETAPDVAFRVGLARRFD